MTLYPSIRCTQIKVCSLPALSEFQNDSSSLRNCPFCVAETMSKAKVQFVPELSTCIRTAKRDNVNEYIKIVADEPPHIIPIERERSNKCQPKLAPIDK